MPSVYDDEKEDLAVNNGHHDDLGVSDEQRESEVNDLEKSYNSDGSESSGGLEQAEKSADTPEASSADKDESSALESSAPAAKDGGWLNSVKSVRNKSKQARNMGIAAGAATILIGGIVAIMSFLIPFKLTHIIESIEQRVGQVPEYAVEQRMEYYMNRYLILRTMAKMGAPEADLEREFVHLGGGPFATLYTNWKGAKIEADLFERDGVNLRPRGTSFNPNLLPSQRQYFRPGQWELDFNGRTTSLNSPEARQFIRTYANDRTKTRQVLKRFHMRRVMRNYYGVPDWKPFERQREDTRNRYNQRKLAFKINLAEKTVGRLTDRYDLYFDCLKGGSGQNCRELLKRPDPPGDLDPNRDYGEDGDEETRDILEGDSPDDDRTRSRAIMQKLREFGLKKAVAALAGGVGVILAMNDVANVVESLDSGVLSQIVYDKNAQQYMAFGAQLMSANDQIKFGDVEAEDPRVVSEMFNNYTESPVFKSGISSSSVVSAQSERITRECEDGTKTLEAGETVCPEKRLIQNKESFKNIAGWDALVSAVAAYRATPIDSVIDFVQNAFNAFLNATGLTSMISKLMDVLGISELAAIAFEKAMYRIASPVISGTEVGGEAYEALFAAVAVRQSGLGGDVGTAKQESMGGAYMTNAQVAVVHDQQMTDYYAMLERKPALERYFSPAVKESLVGNFAMTMPATVSGAGQQTLAALTPSKFVSMLGNLFTMPRVKAQQRSYSNPFHALNMGFPANHEIFTANNGDGMDYDEISEKYNCAAPVEEREQNKKFGTPDNLPFEVPVEADPCLLEEAVEQAGSMFFTSEFDATVSGAPAAGQQNTSTSIVGDPYTDTTSVACAPGTIDIGIQDAYTKGTMFKARLCSLPNLPSNGQADKPGSPYSTPGATGFAVVNSRVSGAWFTLINDANAAGLSLSANSSFRSMSHQEALCRKDAACSRQVYTMVARPGSSSHQAGVAIDFNSMNGISSSSNCTQRATLPGNIAWEWMAKYAEKYGFKQYSREAWHWDAVNDASRCGSL